MTMWLCLIQTEARLMSSRLYVFMCPGCSSRHTGFYNPPTLLLWCTVSHTNYVQKVFQRFQIYYHTVSGSQRERLEDHQCKIRPIDYDSTYKSRYSNFSILILPLMYHLGWLFLRHFKGVTFKEEQDKHQSIHAFVFCIDIQCDSQTALHSGPKSTLQNSNTKAALFNGTMKSVLGNMYVIIPMRALVS